MRLVVLIVFATLIVSLGASQDECQSGSSGPGCTPPYWMDNSSEAYWESTSAGALGGANGVNPTIFFPGKAYNGIEGDPVDLDSDGTEYYIQNPGGSDGEFGSGSISENYYSLGVDYKVKERDGAAYIVDGPYKGQCGDGRSSGVFGSGPLDCPTDEGLVDGTDSSSTVSDELSSINSEPVVSIGEDSLFVDEWDEDLYYNVSDDDNGELLSLTEQRSPDFYISETDSSELRQVSTDVNTESLETVTNYDLSPSQNYVKHEELLSTQNSGIVYTSCINSAGYECVNLGNYCTSINSNGVYDYSTREESVTREIDTNDYTTETSGGYGYTIDETDDSFELKIDYRSYDGLDYIDATTCEHRSDIYSVYESDSRELNQNNDRVLSNGEWYTSPDGYSLDNGFVHDQKKLEQGKTRAYTFDKRSSGADYKWYLSTSKQSGAKDSQYNLENEIADGGDVIDLPSGKFRVEVSVSNGGNKAIVKLFAGKNLGEMVKREERDISGSDDLYFSLYEYSGRSGQDSLRLTDIRQQPNEVILGKDDSRDIDNSGDNILPYGDWIENLEGYGLDDGNVHDQKALTEGETRSYVFNEVSSGGDYVWFIASAEQSDPQSSSSVDNEVHEGGDTSLPLPDNYFRVNVTLDQTGNNLNVTLLDKKNGGDVVMKEENIDVSSTADIYFSLYEWSGSSEENSVRLLDIYEDGVKREINGSDNDNVISAGDWYPDSSGYSHDGGNIHDNKSLDEGYTRSYVFDARESNEDFVWSLADGPQSSADSGSYIDNRIHREFTYQDIPNEEFRVEVELASNGNRVDTRIYDRRKSGNLISEYQNIDTSSASNVFFSMYEDDQWEEGRSSLRLTGVAQWQDRFGTSSENSKVYNQTDSGEYNPSYSSTTYSWDIERAEFTDQKIFHTDDAQTARDSISVMFSDGNDYSRPIYHKSYGGEGWYSVDIENNGLPVENHHAVGISRFELETSGGDFITDRVDHRTYNVDGPDGEGDGIIAYNEDSGVVGNTQGFREKYEFSTGELNKNIELDCPNNYTKCLAVIDFEIEDFNQWSSMDPNDASGFEIVSTAHTSKSLSTCMTYQRLGGSITCSYENSDTPLLNGPYSDEEGIYKHFMEGVDGTRNQVDSDINNYPLIHEARITNRDSCVYNGSEYSEGSLVNIGNSIQLEENNYESLESVPTYDLEICANRDNDIGGEWHDINNPTVNDYFNQNRTFDSTEFEEYFRVHPNYPASLEANIKQRGFALEGNCIGENCSVLQEEYIQAPFVEGLPPSEASPWSDKSHINNDNLEEWLDTPVNGYNNNNEFDYSTTVVHNRVQVQSGTGLNSENDQDSETNPGTNLGPMENSEVNEENDQWAFTPNLTYAVANNGTPYTPRRCHGKGSSKDNRIYANSFVNVSDVYNAEESMGHQDGVWIDPDDTKLSATEGGVTCNLQGRGKKDWGYGFDTK